MIEALDIQPCPVSFVGAWYLEDNAICDKLIEYFNKNPEKQRIGESGDPETFATKVMPSIKDSIDIFFYPNEQVEEWVEYKDQLQKCIEKYIEKYPWCAATDKWGLYEATNLQYYKPGGGYKAWHSERVCALYPYNLRHLVFMTYLNDVTDHGETDFKHQRFRVSPRKGLTLIWPADWTHHHRGIPSPTQEKYIITGWLSYLPKEIVDDSNQEKS